MFDIISVIGLFDRLRSSESGTQARRTANTHATIMLTVTVLAIIDIILRLNAYKHPFLDRSAS